MPTTLFSRVKPLCPTFAGTSGPNLPVQELESRVQMMPCAAGLVSMHSTATDPVPAEWIEQESGTYAEKHLALSRSWLRKGRGKDSSTLQLQSTQG